MKLALDVGHLYRRSKPGDRGASYKGRFEADFVVEYVRRTREKLKGEKDLEIFIPDVEKGVLVGDYYERRDWVNKNFGKEDLYIQCHLNAGKGNYGLVMCVLGFDFSDRMLVSELRELEVLYGQALAFSLTKILGIEVRDFDEAKDFITDLNEEDRGAKVITKFRCPAFIYEPCFIDNDKHFEKLVSGEWLDGIAEAISDAVRSILMKSSLK